MFVQLHGQTHLGISPDQVVAVIESINSPNISIPDMGTEPAQAYIVGLRLPSGSFTVTVYLHLLHSNRACIFAAEPLEVALEGYSELEAEAIQFTESMGFMLDNLNFRAQPPEQIARFIETLPFFHEVPPRRSHGDDMGALPDVAVPGALLDPGVPPPSSGAAALHPDAAAALARLLASF